MNKPIGDRRDESLVEEIFGSVSEFARQVEENGNVFVFGKFLVTYDSDADVHYFTIVK